MIIYSLILLILAIYGETGYCQSTCPLNKITPDSIFASRLMFYMGNFMLLAICAAIIIAGFLFLPKRIRTCPVSKLAKGKKLEILSGDKRLPVSGDSNEFNSIVSNLTDERKQADPQVSTMRMYIYVSNTRYTVEVSMAGWNFLNEEKNSRRLINNMQVMKTVDSLIDNAPAPVVQ
jgi:hypothetical protein